jgi:hypothetical protein
MQLEQVTFDILRELEIVSDTEGTYVFDLAEDYLRD